MARVRKNRRTVKKQRGGECMYRDVERCQLLELDQTACKDDSQIKKAYIRLARIHHPDKGGNAEKFKEVDQAYKDLVECVSTPLTRSRASSFASNTTRSRSSSFASNFGSENFVKAEMNRIRRRREENARKAQAFQEERNRIRRSSEANQQPAPQPQQPQQRPASPQPQPQLQRPASPQPQQKPVQYDRWGRPIVSIFSAATSPRFAATGYRSKQRKTRRHS